MKLRPSPVIASLLLLLVAVLAPVAGRAALVWDSLEADLKAKSGDKEAVATFHFTNTGKTPVTITQVLANCGCTTTELAKKTYAPGEEGSIKAIFTIGVRVGTHEKHVQVTTDDAPATPVTLTLRVNIEELLVFSPQLLMWDDKEAPGEKPISVGAVSPHKISDVRVTSIEPANAAIARVEPLEPGKKYQIWVRPGELSNLTKVTLSCLAKLEDNTEQAFVVYAIVR